MKSRSLRAVLVCYLFAILVTGLAGLLTTPSAVLADGGTSPIPGETLIGDTNGGITSFAPDWEEDDPNTAENLTDLEIARLLLEIGTGVIF